VCGKFLRVGALVKGYSSMMQCLVEEAANGRHGREIWRICWTVCRRRRHTV